MNILFEKSIRNEKAKLKNVLDKLQTVSTNSIEYNKLIKEKNILIDSLYNAGIKSIMWNKKKFSLLDEINKRKKKNIQRKTKLKSLSDNISPKTITKFNDFNGPNKPTNTEENIIKKKSNKSHQISTNINNGSIKKINIHSSLNKKYDVNDIVNIKTKTHDINAIYMGLVGEDVQDILNKLNKFEKSDTFDGVFVLLRNSVPDIFIRNNIDILLLNENLIGQEQIVKGYTTEGKISKKFKVTINSINLKKHRNIERIAANTSYKIEKSILETINSDTFKKYLNKLNNNINIMKFESKFYSDFIEVEN